MVDIVMNGPGKNSLGTEMMAFVEERLKAAGGSPVLLTGAGDAFSAGLNLKEVASLNEADMSRFLDRLEATLCALYQYPAPVVALVNGHAIAGGCVLALCCDWRVGVDNPKVRMGLNEVALGLRFPPRIWEIVRRQVPSSHHQEVLLGAGLFEPGHALRVGLLDVVASDAEGLARRELERLSKLPAKAYAATKRDLRGDKATDLYAEDAWKLRVREMLPVWTSPEVKQRVLAVLGK
jgi:enoyl-CoA hydratase